MACPTAGFSHGVVAAPALLPGEEGEVTRLEGRIGVLTGALGMGEAREEVRPLHRHCCMRPWPALAACFCSGCCLLDSRHVSELHVCSSVGASPVYWF